MDFDYSVFDPSNDIPKGKNKVCPLRYARINSLAHSFDFLPSNDTSTCLKTSQYIQVEKNDPDFDHDKHTTLSIDKGVHINNYVASRNTYYEEWIQKTIFWIALNLGFKKIDTSSIELLTSFTINLIQDIARRAQTLARIRSSDCCNYVDVKTVLQNSYINYYNEIFTNAKFLSIKPVPNSISSGHHHSKSKPAQLFNPSFLYYECFLSALEGIGDMMPKASEGNSLDNESHYVPIDLAQSIESKINPESSQKEDNQEPPSNDTGSIGVYVSGGFSAKDEPLYRKLVMSKRTFCHKHFPILPIECYRDRKSTSFDIDYSYSPNGEEKFYIVERQKIAIQSDLPNIL